MKDAISLLTETSLFYPQEENMVLHTISQCFLESRIPVQHKAASFFFPSFHCHIALPLLPLISPRSLTGKYHLEIPQGTQMSWGLLRPTPRGWGLPAGIIQGDPISVPRASWTQKGTAFTLLVANMPQHQSLNLLQPQTQIDIPIWGPRMRPLITDQPTCTVDHILAETPPGEGWPKVQLVNPRSVSRATVTDAGDSG